MALTTVDKARVKQAGHAVIAFGPKFTTLATPSLAALTQDLTCVVLSFAADTDVSYTETQDLCDADARTDLDKRVRLAGNEQPLAVAARLALRSMQYSSTKRCCLAVSMWPPLIGRFVVFIIPIGDNYIYIKQ